MIMPTSRRRTGLWSETQLVTVAMILLSNWIYSTVSTLSCTSTATSSCQWPSSKKIRTGSKVKGVHDDPQTPYARVLASPDVSEAHKTQLRETYVLLDLVDLQRQINELQTAILNSVNNGPVALRHSVTFIREATRALRLSKSLHFAPSPHNLPPEQAKAANPLGWPPTNTIVRSTQAS
jgi:hypothetical protein